MLFSTPQFIDVEDKIAGPLTWRQLLWMIGMVVTLLVVYTMIGSIVFFVLAVPIILLFCALAFYRPQGQPLIIFLFHGLSFFFRPKVAVWERPVARRKSVPTVVAATKPAVREKRISSEELHRLASLMDNH